MSHMKNMIPSSRRPCFLIHFCAQPFEKPIVCVHSDMSNQREQHLIVFCLGAGNIWIL